MRWLIWALGALVFFYAFFQRVAPSVMVADLMRDFDVSAAALGNLSAFYFYAYALVQLPVGVMVDRWGPRRVLTMGLVFACTGGLLFANAEHIDVAYLGRFMVGAGVGFGFVCSLKLAANWFPATRFAMLSGMTMMFGMVGGIAGQAPLSAAVEAYGWRSTMIAAAGFGLLLTTAIWLIVRDRPVMVDEDAAAAPHSAAMLHGLRKAMRIPQTWLHAAIGFSMTATLLAFGALWSVPYLIQAYDLSRPLAAASASLMLIGWAVGAPAIGWLSDHLKRRKPPLVIAATAALVSIVCLLYVPSLPLVAIEVLLFVNGAACGGIVLCFAAVREVNKSDAAGTATAFVNTAVISSGAMFQPAVGWLLDKNWDGAMEAGARIYTVGTYQTAFITLPLCAAIAVVLSFWVRETYCQPVNATD